MCDILCSSFKSGVSVSYSPLALSYTSLAGLQSQTFWGLAFPVENPQAWEPDVRFRSLAPWGEPLQLWLSFCLSVTYPGVWTLIIPQLHLSYWSHCGSFFIFLVVKNCSGSLQVVFVHSCSVNSCNFHVPLGGRELSVFLLCCLGHNVPAQASLVLKLPRWYLMCSRIEKQWSRSEVCKLRPQAKYGSPPDWFFFFFFFKWNVYWDNCRFTCSCKK